MTAITFDTLKLVDTLEQAKLPREQARAIVEVVRESREVTLTEQSNIAQVASERTAAELDTKTGRAIASVREEIVDVREEIADVREEIADVREEIADVRNNITELRGDVKLLRWMLGTLIAIGVTGVAGIGSLVLSTFF